MNSHQCLHLYLDTSAAPIGNFVGRSHELQAHYRTSTHFCRKLLLKYTLITQKNTENKIWQASTIAAGAKRDQRLSIFPPTDILAPLRRSVWVWGKLPFWVKRKAWQKTHGGWNERWMQIYLLVGGSFRPYPWKPGDEKGTH